MPGNAAPMTATRPAIARHALPSATQQTLHAGTD